VPSQPQRATEPQSPTAATTTRPTSHPLLSSASPPYRSSFPYSYLLASPALPVFRLASLGLEPVALLGVRVALEEEREDENKETKMGGRELREWLNENCAVQLNENREEQLPEWEWGGGEDTWWEHLFTVMNG
jgi:hypothetical protein